MEKKLWRLAWDLEESWQPLGYFESAEALERAIARLKPKINSDHHEQFITEQVTLYIGDLNDEQVNALRDEIGGVDEDALAATIEERVETIDYDELLDIIDRIDPPMRTFTRIEFGRLSLEEQVEVNDWVYACVVQKPGEDHYHILSPSYPPPSVLSPEPPLAPGQHGLDATIEGAPIVRA